MAHALMDFAAVAKAHLNLGGVHIHVDPGRIHGQVQRIDGLTVPVQHVFIGASGCVAEHLVAHKAAVHVTELLVGSRPRCVRNAHTAPDTQCTGAATAVSARRLPIDRNRLLDEFRPQHVREPLVQRHARPDLRHRSAAIAPPAALHARWQIRRPGGPARGDGRIRCSGPSSVASVLRNLRRAGVL
jgi:hypothetical protein